MQLCAEAISHWRQIAPDRYDANTRAFLASAGLDPDGLETAVRRAAGVAGELYYVSTIPVGLAGSTSDLDLLMIADIDREAGPPPSTMVFHEQRRVGVKVLASEQVEAAFAEMLRVADLAPDAAMLARAGRTEVAGLKWSDLERLVNGFSRQAGTAYLRRLPEASTWSLLGAREAFLRQKRLADLAALAGKAPSAFGYTLAAVGWGMDMLMSSCGLIKSGDKWLWQRWETFLVESDRAFFPVVVDELARLTEHLRSVDLASNFQVPLASIAARLDEACGFGGGSSGLTLQVPTDTVAHRFLTSALSLHRCGRVAVLESEDWTAIREARNPEALAPRQAAAALTLLQQGFLDLVVQGGESA